MISSSLSKAIWTLFLFLACILTCSTSSNLGVDRHRLAVCISGQISRWLPETTVPYLLKANEDFEFTFFINLQFHLTNHSYVFSTDGHIAFHPTKFTHMSHMEVLRYIHNLYTITNLSEVASMRFVPPMSLAEWQRKSLHGQKADRISQYADMQHVILSFYQHQDACHAQIASHEARHNMTFDYVLSTREDSFYLSPVNLTDLVAHFRHPASPPSTITRLQNCDIITRDCLGWAGINMRWQLMTRNASDFIIAKRFEFYRLLYRQQRQAYNPEQYEKAQMEHYGMKICEIDPNIIPTLVARHVLDDDVCFVKPETLDDCVPRANHSFVFNKLCHRVNQHLRVKIAPIES